MEKKSFGKTADGKEIDEYILKGSGGASVSIISYGATITKVMVPDNKGRISDVVLGFDDIAGYESKENPYFGATIGRVANRIARGTYTVDGREYHAATNNGANTLHGGLKGYDKRVWDGEILDNTDGASVKFSLTDPDGTEGFPGTVKAAVTFTFTDKDVLRIEYSATTDKTTPINLTNHTYWNLEDAGKSTIDHHLLKAYADAYLPVDATQIPTGELASVQGTPIDFRTTKPMGKEIEAMGGDPTGYDHTLVLDSKGEKLTRAVEVYEPRTGRMMAVWTTEPGLQFYSGNFLNGHAIGKHGVSYKKHNAFAFEAQAFPDAINQPKFPSCLLKPGEIYRQVTEYRFSTADSAPF